MAIEVALILSLVCIGASVALCVYYGKQQHQLRLARLQVLQEALRHPALDEHTRTELTRLLGRDHQGWWAFLSSRGALLMRLGYVGFLGVAWLMFCGGGVGWILSELQSWSWRDQEPVMVATIAGFALLTLPAALRELLRRDRAVASQRP